MKSQQKKYLIALPIGLLLLLLGSCERINSNQNLNENFSKDFALAQTELATMMEFVDELSDQTTGKGTPQLFDLQFLSKATQIIVVDSTFFDGDDVEYIIDFGSTDMPFEANQKCLDGRFRAGRFHVTIKTHYIENTAQARVFLAGNERYIYGSDGSTSELKEFEVNLVRELREKLNLNNIEFKAVQNGEEIEIKGNLSIEKTTGINTPGIFGDHYLITGAGEADGKNNEFVWEIITPLKKKLEPGCGMIPVVGVIQLNNERSNRNATLDFDPFENESCDKIVRVNTAGKVIDFVIE